MYMYKYMICNYVYVHNTDYNIPYITYELLYIQPGISEIVWKIWEVKVNLVPYRL